MGVRMALGATGADLLRLVFGQLPKSVGVGSLFGTAAAIAVAWLIRSMFYGVSPFDPAALISVMLMLAAVSVAASWIPARRAASIDPASVLRND
jgi:ABC-type antimicrobial peptide transport system permease subunit